MLYPTRATARRACRNEYLAGGGEAEKLGAYLDGFDFVEDNGGWVWRMKRQPAVAPAIDDKPKRTRKARKRSED